MSSFQDVIGPAGPIGPEGPQGPQGIQGSGGILLASGGPGAGVYMTTVETGMASFTVPAGKVKANDRLRLVSYFVAIQNSQGVTYTHRLKIAGTTNVTSSFMPPISLNNRSLIRLEHEFAFNSVTGQEIYTHLLMSNASSQIGFGAAGQPVAANAQQMAFTGAAVNFAGAIAISWTMQANLGTVGDSSFSSNGWMAEYMPAP